MLVLLNVASIPFNQPLTNLGPQEALAAPCPAPLGLINGGFEQPIIPGGIAYIPQDDVPGWLTTDNTDGTHKIELWRSGTNPLGFPAAVGDQFAEINYLANAQLYQDLDTSTLLDQTIVWSFAHRGRTGPDTMGLYIGPPENEVLIQTFTTDNDAWVYYSGTYTVPTDQPLTRFAYRAIATASGNPSTGNFLDDVWFGTPPCETDLVVEKTASPAYTPGGPIQFTIEITNTGPFDVVGATLVDTVPGEITGVTWECGATPGSACSQASGAGNDINISSRVAPSRTR